MFGSIDPQKLLEACDTAGKSYRQIAFAYEALDPPGRVRRYFTTPGEPAYDLRGALHELCREGILECAYGAPETMIDGNGVAHEVRQYWYWFRVPAQAPESAPQPA